MYDLKCVGTWGVGGGCVKHLLSPPPPTKRLFITVIKFRPEDPNQLWGWYLVGALELL